MATSTIKANGTQTLLGRGTTHGATITLNDSILNYKSVRVALTNSSYTSVSGTADTATEKFKTVYVDGTGNFGISGYQSARIYAFAAYVDDTHIKVQISSGNGIEFYGIN